MRRRKLPPDKRLDWRDPDMPVLRVIVHDDMFGNEVRRETIEVAPETEQVWSMRKMREGLNPKYKDDPTYDLKGKRKRK